MTTCERFNRDNELLRDFVKRWVVGEISVSALLDCLHAYSIESVALEMALFGIDYNQAIQIIDRVSQAD